MGFVGTPSTYFLSNFFDSAWIEVRGGYRQNPQNSLKLKMDVPDRTNKTYKSPLIGTSGAGTKNFLTVRSCPMLGAGQ